MVYVPVADDKCTIMTEGGKSCVFMRYRGQDYTDSCVPQYWGKSWCYTDKDRNSYSYCVGEGDCSLSKECCVGPEAKTTQASTTDLPTTTGINLSMNNRIA